MQKKVLDYSIYYFLGIGGIGMSALARYFNHYKKTCAGYDKTPTQLTSELESEGIPIHFDENTEYLEYLLSAVNKEEVLIIHTPAVPIEHKEYRWLKSNGYTIKKRSIVLGEITKSFKTIAVAGTHGKTTTSTLVAHILKSAGLNCYAFLGGISGNYNTNLLLGSETTEKETYVVVEADEYDRSFLTLHPFATIITSCDPDHLDIYGNKQRIQQAYTDFAHQTQSDGFLLVKNSVDNTLPLKNKHLVYSVISGTERTFPDFYAKTIEVREGSFYFDFESEKCSLKNLQLGIPGDHNVENAVAAIAVCQFIGVGNSDITAATASFKGVRRRFDYRVKNKRVIYVDDYAHHPEELNACISAVRKLYPGKKIHGIFQPHLYTRTRDFADEFAKALDLLDDCTLLPIYPARETPIPGINAEMLLDKMKINNKRILQMNEIGNYIKNGSFELVLTLGAGNIDQLVKTIEEILNERNN